MTMVHSQQQTQHSRARRCCSGLFKAIYDWLTVTKVATIVTVVGILLIFPIFWGIGIASGYGSDNEKQWNDAIKVAIAGGCVIGVGLSLWLYLWIRHCCNLYAPPIESSASTTSNHSSEEYSQSSLDDIATAATAPPLIVIQQ